MDLSREWNDENFILGRLARQQDELEFQGEILGWLQEDLIKAIAVIHMWGNKKVCSRNGNKVVNMRIILKEWTAGLDVCTERMKEKGLKMEIRFLVWKTGRKNRLLLTEQKCELKSPFAKWIMTNLIWDMLRLGNWENYKNLSGALLQSKHRWMGDKVPRMRRVVNIVKS